VRSFAIRLRAKTTNCGAPVGAAALGDGSNLLNFELPVFLHATSARHNDGSSREVSHASEILRDEEGATAIEYGLMAALLALAIIAAVGMTGDRLIAMFSSLLNAFG
jgi:pilus assembly protein Flp/PilA